MSHNPPHNPHATHPTQMFLLPRYGNPRKAREIAQQHRQEGHWDNNTYLTPYPVFSGFDPANTLFVDTAFEALRKGNWQSKNGKGKGAKDSNKHALPRSAAISGVPFRIWARGTQLASRGESVKPIPMNSHGGSAFVFTSNPEGYITIQGADGGGFWTVDDVGDDTDYDSGSPPPKNGKKSVKKQPKGVLTLQQKPLPSNISNEFLWSLHYLGEGNERDMPFSKRKYLFVNKAWPDWCMGLPEKEEQEGDDENKDKSKENGDKDDDPPVPFDLKMVNRAPRDTVKTGFFLARDRLATGPNTGILGGQSPWRDNNAKKSPPRKEAEPDKRARPQKTSYVDVWVVNADTSRSAPDDSKQNRYVRVMLQNPAKNNKFERVFRTSTAPIHEKHPHYTEWDQQAGGCEKCVLRPTVTGPMEFEVYEDGNPYGVVSIDTYKIHEHDPDVMGRHIYQVKPLAKDADRSKESPQDLGTMEIQIEDYEVAAERRAEEEAAARKRKKAEEEQLAKKRAEEEKRRKALPPSFVDVWVINAKPEGFERSDHGTEAKNDPYVKVLIPAERKGESVQEECFRTPAVDDCNAPVWSQEDGTKEKIMLLPTDVGPMQFELWDEDIFSDDMLGIVEIDTDLIHSRDPAVMGRHTYPIKKLTGNPGQTYGTMEIQIEDHEVRAARKSEEEAAAKKKKAEEEALARQKRLEAEAEAKRLKTEQEEDEQRRREEEEDAAKQKAEEEAAARKKAEDDAIARRKANRVKLLPIKMKGDGMWSDAIEVAPKDDPTMRASDVCAGPSAAPTGLDVQPRRGTKEEAFDIVDAGNGWISLLPRGKPNCALRAPSSEGGDVTVKERTGTDDGELFELVEGDDGTPYLRPKNHPNGFVVLKTPGRNGLTVTSEQPTGSKNSEDGDNNQVVIFRPKKECDDEAAAKAAKEALAKKRAERTDAVVNMWAINGKGLYDVDGIGGKSDPYVKIKLPPTATDGEPKEVHKTPVCDNCQNPEWSRQAGTARRAVLPKDSEGPVDFEIWDDDVFGSEPMGVVQIDSELIHDRDPSVMGRHTYDVKRRQKNLSLEDRHKTFGTMEIEIEGYDAACRREARGKMFPQCFDADGLPLPDDQTDHIELAPETDPAKRLRTVGTDNEIMPIQSREGVDPEAFSVVDAGDGYVRVLPKKPKKTVVAVTSTDPPTLVTKAPSQTDDELFSVVEGDAGECYLVPKAFPDSTVVPEDGGDRAVLTTERPREKNKKFLVFGKRHSDEAAEEKKKKYGARKEFVADIWVVGADGIRDVDGLGGKSDPFVTVKIPTEDDSKEVLKTPVVDDSLNPRWSRDVGEAKKVSLLPNADGFVEFEIWDDDTFGKEPLGVVQIDVDKIHDRDPNVIGRHTYPIRKRARNMTDEDEGASHGTMEIQIEDHEEAATRRAAEEEEDDEEAESSVVAIRSEGKGELTVRGTGEPLNVLAGEKDLGSPFNVLDGTDCEPDADEDANIVIFGHDGRSLAVGEKDPTAALTMETQLEHDDPRAKSRAFEVIYDDDWVWIRSILHSDYWVTRADGDKALTLSKTKDPVKSKFWLRVMEKDELSANTAKEELIAAAKKEAEEDSDFED